MSSHRAAARRFEVERIETQLQKARPEMADGEGLETTKSPLIDVRGTKNTHLGPLVRSAECAAGAGKVKLVMKSPFDCGSSIVRATRRLSSHR